MRLRIPDCPPPHMAHARLAARFRDTFLLESRDGPDALARYTFVGFGPVGTVRLAAVDGGHAAADGGHTAADGDPVAPTRLHVEGGLPAPRPGQHPLEYLRHVQALHATQDRTSPFVGGLVGAVGYDLAHALEPRVAKQAPPGAVHAHDPGQEAAPRPSSASDWPPLLLGLYLDALVYDHAAGTAHYVSRGPDRSARLQQALAAPTPTTGLEVGPVVPSGDEARFVQQVQQAQEAIRAGEAFQIVLSRSFSASFSGSLVPLYEWLRQHAPVPYLFHLRFGDRQLVGASPECLVRVRSGIAQTFPIAGTRPVTGDAAVDEAAVQDLRGDRKETAEHAMLVDLARNDLARVCRPTTVRVASFQQTQRFRDVMHLVSRVEGELAPDQDAWSTLAAVFPAGTVSGAPKIRAMEHIAAIEKTPRGPYAGAVCYASLNGDFDSAITIRTLSAQGSRLVVQAGAGIVHRSDPQAEFRETEHKARTLLAALERFGGRVEVRA